MDMLTNASKGIGFLLSAYGVGVCMNAATTRLERWWFGKRKSPSSFTNEQCYPIYPLATEDLLPHESKWIGLKIRNMVPSGRVGILFTIPFTGIDFVVVGNVGTYDSDDLTEAWFVNNTDKVYQCNPDKPICYMVIHRLESKSYYSTR